MAGMVLKLSIADFYHFCIKNAFANLFVSRILNLANVLGLTFWESEQTLKGNGNRDADYRARIFLSRFQ